MTAGSNFKLGTLVPIDKDTPKARVGDFGVVVDVGIQNEKSVGTKTTTLGGRSVIAAQPPHVPPSPPHSPPPTRRGEGRRTITTPGPAALSVVVGVGRVKRTRLSVVFLST